MYKAGDRFVITIGEPKDGKYPVEGTSKWLPFHQLNNLKKVEGAEEAEIIIFALRCCSDDTGNAKCKKDKCRYFVRDSRDSEAVKKFIEEFGPVNDELLERCDCERIERDAADLIERMVR